MGLLEEATCIRGLYIIGKADYATAAIIYKEMKRCLPSWLRKPRNVACSTSCNSDCVCVYKRLRDSVFLGECVTEPPNLRDTNWPSSQNWKRAEGEVADLMVRNVLVLVKAWLDQLGA